MEYPYRWALALLVGLAPALARADGPVTTVFFNTGNETRITEPCPASVTVERRMGGSPERVTMPLLDCDRRPTEEAIRAISVLARPRTSPRPTDDELEAFDPGSHPGFVAEGVLRIHPELLDRLQHLGEALGAHAIQIYSGYRPRSAATSRHHHGRALDLMVDGVERERVRDVALTFERTGVGWYPNSVFVHLDVRDDSHYWVDLSGPGEPPNYVRGAAPPPPTAEAIGAMLEGVGATLEGISVPEM